MKDFFDEEFEKQQQQQEQTQQQHDEEKQRQINDWYGTPAGNTNNTATSSKRPLYITLICVALVLAIILGWVLCAIFGGSRSQEEGLLSTVMTYLENEYYQDITDAEMQEAVAAAGTAMLQSAGDQFCQLMSPQQFYNYIMQVENTKNLSDANGYFGISFTHYGVGLYVSSVSTDSSCYGILQTGDVVLKFTNMVDKFGKPVTLAGVGEFSELVVADYADDVVDAVMAKTAAANFVYIRNGEMYNSGLVERGAIGFPEGHPNSKYKFIEYYFDSATNNISTSNLNNAKHNTYELRGLSSLPADTGYIRIVQFMFYPEGEDEVTAYNEFLEVMQLFKQKNLKRLVLDLKGNPGGRVDVVCDIASLLVTDAKLAMDEKNMVNSPKGLQITSLVPKNAAATEVDYRASKYSTYFNTPSSVADIVVWTDGGSASASELLTGALTDYQTGFQIGTRTYGKGIAQRIVPLQTYTGKITPVEGDTQTTYPWAIYYTFASYYSPLGTNIHGKGYTPSQGYDKITDYGSRDKANSLWKATYKYWNL